MEKRKAPKWENEDWVVEHPDPQKICCKDCYGRAKDIKVSEDSTIKGCTLGVCDVYDSKPDEILFKNEMCPYYVNEKDVEDA